MAKPPKPLLVNPGGGATPSEPQDYKAAVKKVGSLRGKKKNRQRNRRNSEIKPRQYAQFFFADGRVTSLKMLPGVIKQFGIPVPEGEQVNVEGSRIAGIRRGQQTKTIQISFGRKKVTRKGKKGATQAKSGSVQNWRSFTVPQTATLADLMHWIGQFKVKPGILRYGRQDIVIDAKVANKVAL